MFIASGRQLAPRDRAAAEMFRTDPSCTAPLSADVPPGACKVVAAQVLVAAMRTGGFARTRSKTPYVYLTSRGRNVSDGPSSTDPTDGDFVESVKSGARARAQLFRGTLVRVVSGSSSAETDAAPDISAAADSEMPWVGAVLIAIAAVFGFAAVRAARRLRTAV